jgi:hypothetical protein
MTPPCPQCHTANHARPHGNNLFYCGKCGGIYDADPDEGGDYFRDPAKRMEVEERRRDRSGYSTRVRRGPR